MSKVAIVGVGISKFGNRKGASLRELAFESFKEAVEDAGIEKDEIQAVVTGCASDEFAVPALSVPFAKALLTPSPVGLLDAIKVLEEGLTSTEDIDTGMKLGLNHPMGPLTLLDFVGLDTTHSIANIMFEEFREQRFAPPPLLKKMVLAGYYGRKSGKGFYDYSGDKPAPSDLGI